MGFTSGLLTGAYLYVRRITSISYALKPYRHDSGNPKRGHPHPILAHSIKSMLRVTRKIFSRRFYDAHKSNYSTIRVRLTGD